MSSNSFHFLKVKEIRKETADCVSIVFDVPEALNNTFKFKSGQYLTLRQTINDEDVRRSYSICAAPSENELRVAVKNVESGKFSGFANTLLKVGDELEVMPPLGKFSPRDKSAKDAKNYLAFVAGSGITPVISIMKSALEENPETRFTLVFGNKSKNSIIFKEALEALKNKYMERLAIYHVFTRETSDTPLFNGRLTEEKVNEFCDSLIHIDKMDEVFICGPETMILSLRKYFVDQKKVDTKNIHIELFSSPDEPKIAHQEWEKKTKNKDSNKVAKVTIRLDGASYDMDVPFNGDTILDTALMQGLDLPYACKGGVCCTCRAKLEEGEVEMEVNYALEEDEVANNFILTCQSHPRTERVIVNFDVK